MWLYPEMQDVRHSVNAAHFFFFFLKESITSLIVPNLSDGGSYTETWKQMSIKKGLIK